jgi:hypothetical protein
MSKRSLYANIIAGVGGFILGGHFGLLLGMPCAFLWGFSVGIIAVIFFNEDGSLKSQGEPQ